MRVLVVLTVLAAVAGCGGREAPKRAAGAPTGSPSPTATPTVKPVSGAERAKAALRGDPGRLGPLRPGRRGGQDGDRRGQVRLPRQPKGRLRSLQDAQGDAGVLQLRARHERADRRGRRAPSGHGAATGRRRAASACCGWGPARSRSGPTTASASTAARTEMDADVKCGLWWGG